MLTVSIEKSVFFERFTGRIFEKRYYQVKVVIKLRFLEVEYYHDRMLRAIMLNNH